MPSPRADRSRGCRDSSIGATSTLAIGETQGNKNDPSGAAASVGLSSFPVTFAYTTSADGTITGGNQPLQAATDPAGLLNLCCRPAS
ncbi:hypothetical protein ACRAWC_22890 [Leifsonia sp. L25]|uniref:hypothetical protein n=1 Tax=Leifsonia sp. L25 TaxID=3423957 RepID=UPI003D680B32